ncbi:hypothetical protein BMS3Abin17_00154 [archaeon BMS3Abin17]|nr:hypothetical protein BMS3Abin17_00154 [archaeon BMS3Abin17]HDZ60301.1 hypothetical protein [Candidatus Pacearchaeota archaeon]
MKKETIKTIAIVILILVIILGIFYFMVLPVYNQNVYNAGVNEGQMALIRQQMATGNIALIDGNGTIISKSIAEICAITG